MNKIFEEFSLKNLKLRNRIVMPPMCMYSADDDGKANSWHFTHYETRSIGGVGMIIVEATAVEKRGRISANDLGIWDDEHVEGLSEISSRIKKHGSFSCIQLAHAGRKCDAPDMDVIAPSSIAFSDKYMIPREMNNTDIDQVVESFASAAARALKAGFDAIEVHAAHGYLLNEFISPLTNRRNDQYGGDVENRSRLLYRVIEKIREIWPEEKALVLRVSAYEYSEDGNSPEDIAAIINKVKHLGVDLVNVSSGGVILSDVDAYPGYQTKFAEIVADKTGLPVVSGGLLSDANHIDDVLSTGNIQLVFLGRELLRNPYWPLQNSRGIENNDFWPKQYERAK